MKAAEKVAALREKMREHHIDAYIINSSDAHQSEYVTDYWRGRAWLSGFTGSNGTVVVTAEEAGLWTDGRYFIQAERQLAGSGIVLYRMNEEGVPTYRQWLTQRLPENGVLGFDGRTYSVTEFDSLKAELGGVSFSCAHDLLEEIWPDRPPMPNSAAFAHEERFAGMPAAEKLARVREAMKEKKADAYLASSLDDIAWLLNIRGHDIPQTPVVYAYTLITPTDAVVFVDLGKLSPALCRQLADDGFTPRAYDEVFSCVRALTPGSRLLYDPDRVNMRLAEAVPDTVTVIRGEDPTTLMKAIKNEKEIHNIRHAHIKEGVVMVRLLKWLDDWAKNENREPLTEWDIHGILTRYRKEQADYWEPSFETIAAYRENAASMHYSPEEGCCKTILPEGFLLVDTGAQYGDGTTDITRTIAMGSLTDEMKTDYTLVLKGHIALASAQFLFGTTGTQLDVLARAPMWAVGMNYRSGTGHGIGYCLGVHEGPQRISTHPSSVKLTEGMLCSNEPGVYKEGRHGIRTENTVLVEKRFTNEDGTFMGFETISFCPLDLRAIDTEIMTPPEIRWLNAYHRQVYDNLAPRLREDERAWLAEATAQLPEA